MLHCPYCQATDQQVRAGNNPSGSQRFLCKVCGKKPTPSPTPIGYPEETRKQVILICMQGQSFRSVARKMSVNPQTVVNWINAYVAATSRVIYGFPKK